MKSLALLTLFLLAACCDQPNPGDCPSGWYPHYHYQTYSSPHGYAIECRKLPWTP